MINSINKVSSWTKDGDILVDTSNTALTISNLNLENENGINERWRHNNLIRIECEGRTYICDAIELKLAIDNAYDSNFPRRGTYNKAAF